MIGKRIQDLLHAKQADVKDLAAHLGVTPQAVYRWLPPNNIEPRLKRKEAIAAFFNIKPQDLEYAPVLTLIPIARSAGRKPTVLDEQSAMRAADLMITDELSGLHPKSDEYLLGMKHRIIFALSKISIESSFKAGTCQADAYYAGAEHAQSLLDQIQL